MAKNRCGGSGQRAVNITWNGRRETAYGDCPTCGAVGPVSKAEGKVRVHAEGNNG